MPHGLRPLDTQPYRDALRASTCRTMVSYAGNEYPAKGHKLTNVNIPTHSTAPTITEPLSRYLGIVVITREQIRDECRK